MTPNRASATDLARGEESTATDDSTSVPVNDRSGSHGLPWLGWRGVVLLLVAASFWPFYVMAANPASIVRPERLLAIIAFAFLTGVVVVRVLGWRGMPRESAENTGFLVVVLLMSAGPVIRQLGPVAIAVLVLAPVVAGWLFVRMQGHIIVSALIWGTAAAVASGPAVALTESLQSQGPSAVVKTVPIAVELSETPDIFLVVFDGYPGSISSGETGLGSGVVDVVSDLRSRQFEVPDSSWSSYWTTVLSIPSLMEMNYVVQREWAGLDTERDLHRILAGDSTVIEILRDAGYRTHMVESGWSGGSCGSGFDICVPAPLVDEATYLTLEQTAAWGFLRDSPGPSIQGTIAAFDWLSREAPALSRSSTSDFVFAHVIAPHPPLYLTPECSVDLAEDRGGTFFQVPSVPAETRAGYFAEQMDCMDSFMLSLADALEPEDVIIYTSDHGTDSHNQLDPAFTDWGRDAVVERMNNFLAVRLPMGCDIGNQIVVPNIFRGVFDCLSTNPVDDLPERIWVNPMRALPAQEVDDLLAMR